MRANHKLSLAVKIIAPVVTIFLVALIALVIFIFIRTKDNVVQSTVAQAIDTIKQYKILRGYYTTNVIKKVKGNNVIKIDFNHKDKANTIPLPATMIHDLSEEMAEKMRNVKLRLYSAFPFPHRNKRQLDPFQQAALNYLQDNPQGQYFRTFNNGKIVRLAIGDMMQAEACVHCHNTHPLTPKRDWKLGDLRGVLEIESVVTTQLERNRSLLVVISMVTIIGLILLTLLLFVIIKKFTVAPIQNIVEEIFSTTSNAAKISSNVTILSGQVSSNSQSQAAFIEQTAASVSELTNGVKSNAMGANEAQGASDQNKEVAGTGSSDVALLITSINELSESSGHIEEFTKVVDSIAFQTNLLALNAAVEAARAGEEGKGFAVVAEAVRSLAQKSAEAAKEINILIVDNIQRSEKGVESAKKCEASFEAVISKASEVNGLVGSIAQSSDEQLMAVNNLAQAMNGIDQSVQSNASAADQTDSASTSLDEQVQKINQLVTQLRNYL